MTMLGLCSTCLICLTPYAVLSLAGLQEMTQALPACGPGTSCGRWSSHMCPRSPLPASVRTSTSGSGACPMATFTFQQPCESCLHPSYLLHQHV